MMKRFTAEIWDSGQVHGFACTIQLYEGPTFIQQTQQVTYWTYLLPPSGINMFKSDCNHLFILRPRLINGAKLQN